MFRLKVPLILKRPAWISLDWIQCRRQRISEASIISVLHVDDRLLLLETLRQDDELRSCDWRESRDVERHHADIVDDEP